MYQLRVGASALAQLQASTYPQTHASEHGSTSVHTRICTYHQYIGYIVWNTHVATHPL